MDANGSLQRWEWVLFATLLLLHLVPLWAFGTFPTQDGPAHLETSHLLGRLLVGDTLLQRFFEISWRLEPNLLTQVALALLMGLVSPLTAQQVLLSLYVVLLPLAVLYALRGVRRESGFLVVLVFPFVYSWSCHMGFFNFVVSLPLFFFTLGYWLRRRHRLGLGAAATVAGLLLLVYLAHLVTLVMLCAALAILSGGSALARRAAWRDALLTWLAFLPAGVLTLLFLRSEGVTSLQMFGVIRKLEILLMLHPLVSFDGRELYVVLPLVVLFAALVGVALRLRGEAAELESSRPSGALRGEAAELGSPLLAVLLLYLAVHLLAPDRVAGGSLLNLRLVYFPYFALLLWLGARLDPGPPRSALRIVTAVAGSLVAVGLLAFHLNSYVQLDDRLKELFSLGRHIPAGRTLLAISYDDLGRDASGRPLSVAVRPFRHAASLIAVERGAVHLSNYQANLSYFPVHYREAVNPYTFIGRLDTTPRGELQLLSFRERTGASLDYVLIWSLDAAPRTDRGVRSLLDQLQRGFDLVAVSKPRGLARLYRRAEERTRR